MSPWISTPGEAKDPLSRAIGTYQTAAIDVFTDDATGVKLSIPTSVFNPPKIERWGRSWTTADHRISVDTLNFGNTETLDNWFNKLLNKSNRIITKRFIDKNSFVLEGRDVGRQAGTDSLFHVEAHVHNAEIRGLSIVYSASAQKELAPEVQSIISSLNPFPTRVIAATAANAGGKTASPDAPVRQPASPAQTSQDLIADKKLGERRAEVEAAAIEVAKQKEKNKRLAEKITTASIAKPQLAEDFSKQLELLKKQNEILTEQLTILRERQDTLRPAFVGSRIALVLGNNKYPNLPSDQQLVKAVNDARTMGDVLEQVGFKVIRGENLDRAGMNDRLFDFLEKVKPGDMAVIFYAGHGVSFAGGNYVLPTDVKFVGSEQEGRVRTMAIGEADIIAEVQKREPGIAIVMLDACRDNPFRKPGLRSTGRERGLDQSVPAQGIFSVYSAGLGQSALDSLGPNDPSPNSIFTRVMSSELYRDAPLNNIMIYVRQEVAKLAKTVQHEQDPAYYDQTRGGFVYVAAPVSSGAAKGVGGPLERVRN